MSDEDVPIRENQGAATAGAPDIDVVIDHAAWRDALDEPAALCRGAAKAALDATGFGPLAPRVDLGVRLARVPVPPLPDNPLTTGNHAADPGVGVGGVEAAPSEFERARHVAAVRGVTVRDAHRHCDRYGGY